MPAPTAAWLPPGWQHPLRVDVTPQHHLRPIRAADVDLDLPAVMGSRERLWELYGDAWGWPPPTMTYEEDRADLQRHAEEIEAHESFNYALFDTDETELIGCVYIDPPVRPETDAEISWWVRDEHVDTAVGRALDALVPQWIARDWPLRRPHLGPPGRAAAEEPTSQAATTQGGGGSGA